MNVIFLFKQFSFALFDEGERPVKMENEIKKKCSVEII